MQNMDLLPRGFAMMSNKKHIVANCLRGRLVFGKQAGGGRIKDEWRG